MARRSYGSSKSSTATENKIAESAPKVKEEPKLNIESVSESKPSEVVQTVQSTQPKKKRRTYGTTSVSKPVLSSEDQFIGKSDKTSLRGSETPSETTEKAKSTQNNAEKGKKVVLKPKKVKQPLTASQKRKRVFAFAMAFIFLAVAGYFGYKAFLKYREDTKIQAMWDSVKDECVKHDKLEGDDGYSKDPFDREIDWDKLFAINKDVKCWIYIPGTNIDYPVLQEQELSDSTFYYLSHDIYKNYNYMGCILACKEPDGFEDKDAHLTLYGHKMMGKQMFGNLDLYKSEEFGAENPYVYLYYPDRTERWSVWSAFHTDKDDMIYVMPYEIGTNGYLDLINHIDSSKLYKTQSGTPDELEKTLTLSTCDNPRGGHNGRFTVSCRINNQSRDIKWYNTESQKETEKEQNETRKEIELEKQKKQQEDNANGNYYDVYTIEYNSDDE